VGPNVEQTIDTSTRVRFETEAETETEKTITPEEVNKERYNAQNILSIYQ
jgi:hypothetical protein